MNRRAIVIATFVLSGCASVWGWNGPAQRREVAREGGEVIKEYRDGDLLVLVWRRGPQHYGKWICHTGYVHDCFDGYSVDQTARACTVAHSGPESVVDCAGLKADKDLGPYVTW